MDDDSLSWTKEVGMHAASMSGALKVSAKQPRELPKICGVITKTPLIDCSSNLKLINMNPTHIFIPTIYGRTEDTCLQSHQC